jgi:hypothetical protein
MRILFCLAGALLAAALALAGCARNKAATGQSFPGSGSVMATNASTGESVIITPSNGIEGKVSSVNANLRFVVLTFPIGRLPALNRRLNLYRNGLKVAEIIVTGPQRDDSIVADIIAGEAQTGDQARDR